MQGTDWDEAIVDHRTYGVLDKQHALFSALHIIKIERQHERFVDAARAKLLSLDFEAEIRQAMAGRPMLVRAINQMDNPDRAKYKKITHAWFQPRRVRHIEERIGELAGACVDQMLDSGGVYAGFTPASECTSPRSRWLPLSANCCLASTRSS
jgi:cytochrome P450